jgi:hypothetical protein
MLSTSSTKEERSVIVTMKPTSPAAGKRSRSRISFRCLFFSGLLALSLLFTIIFTFIQPNLLAATKVKFVDRASVSSRPVVSTREFQLGGGDDDAVTAVDVVPVAQVQRPVLVPTVTNARVISRSPTKIAAKKKKSLTGMDTGRPPLPDSVKSFEVDAFKALEMYELATTRPNTGANRKENKNMKQKMEKKEKKARNPMSQMSMKDASNRVNTREGFPQVAWIMSFGGSVSYM